MTNQLECPEVFTVKFGRALVAHIGGDPARIKKGWCWQQFGRHHSTRPPVFV